MFWCPIICSMLKQIQDTNSLLPSLQRLLCDVFLSPLASTSPADFLNRLGIEPDKEDNAFRFFTALYERLNACFESCTLRKDTLSPFFGGLQKQLQCCMKCHRAFYRPERFYFINCTIISDTRLEEALQRLYSKEVIPDSSFICPSFTLPPSLTHRCQTHCSGEALTTIAELPPILVIRLERATPGCIVRVPLSLDLLPLCSLVHLTASHHK